MGLVRFRQSRMSLSPTKQFVVTFPQAEQIYNITRIYILGVTLNASCLCSFDQMYMCGGV